MVTDKQNKKNKTTKKGKNRLAQMKLFEVMRQILIFSNILKFYLTIR